MLIPCKRERMTSHPELHTRESVAIDVVSIYALWEPGCEGVPCEGRCVKRGDAQIAECLESYHAALSS